MEVHEDPILSEFKFCEKCLPNTFMLIEYIRNLENAQVVAKEALETINLANAKLTKELQVVCDERDDLKEKLSKQRHLEMRQKMTDLENKHHRLVSRSKM